MSYNPNSGEGLCSRPGCDLDGSAECRSCCRWFCVAHVGDHDQRCDDWYEDQARIAERLKREEARQAAYDAALDSQKDKD